MLGSAVVVSYSEAASPAGPCSIDARACIQAPCTSKCRTRYIGAMKMIILSTLIPLILSCKTGYEIIISIIFLRVLIPLHTADCRSIFIDVFILPKNTVTYMQARHD